jgi:hypothetical protein
MLEVGRALHLVPGDSAAGSVRQAFRAAGCGDEIVALSDDLGSGPIDRIDAAARMGWWTQVWEIDDQDLRITTFWHRVATAEERIVVWAGRGSASEHCFLLAVAQALRGRSFSLIDVTGMGRHADNPAWHGQLGTLVPGVLQGLIGTERRVGKVEHSAMAARWEALQRENAPFRVATEEGVVSVPEDYSDDELLAEAREQPTRVARVIGGAMARGRAYHQVGDVMLLVRLVALVEAGRLVVDGDPWDMRTSRVWLPK